MNTQDENGTWPSAEEALAWYRCQLADAKDSADYAWRIARLIDRSRQLEMDRRTAAEASCAAFGQALEAMRVAGGRDEFQAAWDAAKGLLEKYQHAGSAT